MSTINPAMMCSPPLDAYPAHGGHWISPPPPSSSSSRPGMPILMPMNHSDQMQLHHHLSVNVTDHYELTTNPTHYFSGYSAATSSSNVETMSLNGSSSSGASTNDSSSYPLLAPMPTLYFNQYAQPPSGDRSHQQPYFSPPVLYPSSPMSPRSIHEQQHVLNDMSFNKYVHLFHRSFLP